MRLTKQQFIDRFTPVEMASILAAAKASVEVEAWLFRFQNLTPDPDGTSVDTADARTIAGLQALEHHPDAAARRLTSRGASEPRPLVPS